MKFVQVIFFLFNTVSVMEAQIIPVFNFNDPVINKKDKIIFTSIEKFTFQGKLAPVILKNTSGIGLIGFVNRKGGLVVPAQYESIGEIRNGNFIVSKNGRYGLINQAGELVVDCKFKELKFKNDETMFAKNFYLWQVKDSLNKSFERFDADSILAESDTIYRCFLNDQSFLSKHKAKRILVYEQPNKISTKNNFPYTTWKYKGRVAYENYDCNLVVPPVYDSVKYISSDSIFVVYWKNKIGILENDGSEIMPLTNKYQKIYNFSSSRARILKDGRYGFLDRFGNVRVSPQYENVKDFSEGFAAVFLAGKWGFLDRNENLVVQPFYYEVESFSHGTARVKEKNKWSFVNSEGIKITTTPYDEIIPTEYKKWFIVNNKKYGLADSSGREMLGPKYEFIRDLNNGYIIVKRNGKWGVLDYQENFVIPMEYDSIEYDKFNNCFFAGIEGKEEPININSKQGRERTR
ncbi:MAG TPA: WG repeat-containing protein [Cytophagaceae bacterium]|nr:WG repeat-containing protein [Cytophagaceae bacterium]